MSAAGYDSVVSPASVTVSRRVESVALSNDVYILTGLRASSDDLQDGRTEILVSSPSNTLQASARNISLLGTSIFRIFRRAMVIKTLGDGDLKCRAVESEKVGDTYNYSGIMAEAETRVPVYQLEFIRITPVRVYKPGPQVTPANPTVPQSAAATPIRK